MGVLHHGKTAPLVIRFAVCMYICMYVPNWPGTGDGGVYKKILDIGSGRIGDMST